MEFYNLAEWSPLEKAQRTSCDSRPLPPGRRLSVLSSGATLHRALSWKISKFFQIILPAEAWSVVMVWHDKQGTEGRDYDASIGGGVEARSLFPTEALMAVLVCLGFSGHRFILSGTRIGFFSCLSSILCPVASKLSCSCPWEFDYHLPGETGRDFKQIHSRSLPLQFFFSHLDFLGKRYMEDRWVGLWT